MPSLPMYLLWLGGVSGPSNPTKILRVGNIARLGREPLRQTRRVPPTDLDNLDCGFQRRLPVGHGPR